MTLYDMMYRKFQHFARHNVISDGPTIKNLMMRQLPGMLNLRLFFLIKGITKKCLLWHQSMFASTYKAYHISSQFIHFSLVKINFFF